MRVLIDESLPRQLVPLLIGHAARMVQTEGWSSVQNGELLHVHRKNKEYVTG